MDIINPGLQFRGNLSKRKSTKRIILHHAAASNAEVQTIHKWHLGRGWAGTGYNFYVRKDGSIYQGRGWEYVGAHCEGYNSTSIGICFEGNFETEAMPIAQLNAGVELIKLALSKYPDITEVCGHKTHGATACPGRYFPLDKMTAVSQGNGGGAAGTGSGPSTTRNETVRTLQEALNEDGIRDTAGRPLSVDGIKGVNTAAAIKKVLLKSGDLSGGRYKVGSTGELVKWLQDRLNSKLGCSLTIDGKFGASTREAVGQWQERNNLTVDYKAGVDTLTSLL